MTDKIKTFAVIPYENSLNVKNITREEFLVKYKLWLKDKNLFNDDMEYDLEHIRKNGEKALRIGNFVYAAINDKSEKAYLILNIPYEDAEILARSFAQERFFYAVLSDDNLHFSLYKTFNVCKTYKLIETSDTIKHEDDFIKYGFKFIIDDSYFENNAAPIFNDYEFAESMDPNGTFMSRSLHRRRCYML